MNIKQSFSIICLSLILFLIGAFFQEVYGQCRYDFETTEQGWVVESHPSTRGAISVGHSQLKTFSGNHSLMAKLKLSRRPDSLSQGEIRVDLRTDAPGDQFGPLNLAGKVVKVYVYFPKGFEGESNSPNGIQLFAKSIHTDSTGHNEIKSLYGYWKDASGQSGKWLEIKLLISEKPGPGIYIEKGFDPKSIGYIGVKFGIGGNSNAKFEGDVFIDCVSW